MFNKEVLLRKISSRKFWALIAGVATSICVLTNAGDAETVKITGLIGAVGSVAVYMLAEGYVDGKAVESADCCDYYEDEEDELP